MTSELPSWTCSVPFTTTLPITVALPCTERVEFAPITTFPEVEQFRPDSTSVSPPDTLSPPVLHTIGALDTTKVALKLLSNPAPSVITSKLENNPAVVGKPLSFTMDGDPLPCTVTLMLAMGGRNTACAGPFDTTVTDVVYAWPATPLANGSPPVTTGGTPTRREQEATPAAPKESVTVIESENSLVGLDGLPDKDVASCTSHDGAF